MSTDAELRIARLEFLAALAEWRAAYATADRYWSALAEAIEMADAVDAECEDDDEREPDPDFGVSVEQDLLSIAFNGRYTADDVGPWQTPTVAWLAGADRAEIVLADGRLWRRVWLHRDDPRFPPDARRFAATARVGVASPYACDVWTDGNTYIGPRTLLALDPQPAFTAPEHAAWRKAEAVRHAIEAHGGSVPEHVDTAGLLDMLDDLVEHRTQLRARITAVRRAQAPFA